MTTQSPKVNVCIPVYNGSAYIADSIKSILNQTFEDFSVIISDNCSTDNTVEVVLGFNDPRIVLSENSENIGLVANFNRVLDLADAEYIVLWAHDDIMLADNLRQKVHLLDKNPNVGIVHSDVLMIDDEGNQHDFQMFKDSKQDYIENGQTVFHRYIMNMPRGAMFFIGSVMARRECYQKLGGFNPRLPNTGDSELWMRIALFYDVACISEPLVTYRHHQAMTSAANSESKGMNIQGFDEHYLCASVVIDNHKDRISERQNLRKQLTQAFAFQAIRMGSYYCNRNNFTLAKAFVMKAFNMHPQVIIKAVFWKVAKKLLLNQK